jgi:hypothetical protein
MLKCVKNLYYLISNLEIRTWGVAGSHDFSKFTLTMNILGELELKFRFVDYEPKFALAVATTSIWEGENRLIRQCLPVYTDFFLKKNIFYAHG